VTACLAVTARRRRSAVLWRKRHKRSPKTCASIFFLLLGTINCWGQDNLAGGHLHRLHCSNWLNVIGLLFCLGLWVALPVTIVVLYRMQRTLKKLGTELDGLDKHKRNSQDDNNSSHDD